MKKTEMEFSEKQFSRTRELHLARRDMSQFDDSRRLAESAQAKAESDLANAKKTVRDLTSRIEESNGRTRAYRRELQNLRKKERGEEGWGLDVREIENYQYAEEATELESLKQELSKLKLDMASVLEQKKRAEKEFKDSSSRICSYSSSAEALTKELGEVNEEQLLTELARTEAVKELGTIKAQRKEECGLFSSAIATMKKKMDNVCQESNRTKELETKLSVTTYDVKVLQNELKMIKEMERRVQRNESLRRTEQVGSLLVLEMVKEELEKAREELASIAEERFQLMSSMDLIRDELKHISQEKARFKRTDEKSEAKVQNLNMKLLRANGRLEAVSTAEEKVKRIASNLSLALEQSKLEAEAAEKKRELICEETVNIKVGVQKTESEIESTEKKLEAAIQELEAAKSSESAALDNLKSFVEKTIRGEFSAFQHDPNTIRISKFEYEYLTGQALGAEEIAVKKVEAAQAWIEALKASEKEILMKVETARRNIKELLLIEEKRENSKMESTLSAKRVAEGEMQNWREKSTKNSEPNKLQPEVALPRKSMKANGSLTPARRARFRKFKSPATRNMSSPSYFTVTRKRKVMPNLAKFFNRNIEKDRCFLVDAPMQVGSSQ